MRFTPRRALLAAAALALLAALLRSPGAPESSPERTVRPAADRPAAALTPAVEPPPRRPPPKPLTNPLDKISMGIVAAPAGGGADFVTRDRIANTFFTSKGVTFALVGPATPGGGPSEKIATTLRWGLDGAAEVKPRPEGARETKINVFKGDRSTWTTGTPAFSSVVYEGVRPGVDLTVESRPQSLKYTMQAARAADMGDLRFNYGGSHEVRVIEDGAAVEIVTQLGTVREDGLAVWQDAPEGRRPVEARYVPAAAGGVEISLGPVDPDLPLTVDPVISWSGYLGGAIGSVADDYAYGVAADAAGNVYVAGYTSCTNLPGVGVGSLSQTLGGTVDGFLMKLDTNAGTIVWATYLGGSSSDYAYAVALDSFGNPVVTGYTLSSDFPTTPGAYDRTPATPDAFVMKLTPAGALTWSTLLGGTSSDYGQAIRVDGATGDVYIGGYTYSSNFPIVSGFDASLGTAPDGFVAKLSAAGDALLWSTFLGGSDTDVLNDLAVDSQGNVYATGYTYSTDFPTPGGLYTTHGGSTDAFLSKISSTGSSLLWSTFLGGSSGDYGNGVTVPTDGSDEVVIVGYTSSANFPPGLGYDTTISGTDAFVTRFKSTGGGVIYSTFLGGSSTDYAYAVAPGPNGSVYVVGQTYSTNFPFSLGAYRTTMVGSPDAFVSQLDQTGLLLLASTYLGGGTTDIPRAVAVTGSGVYVAGYTYSNNFSQPAAPMIDGTLGGTQDGFMARLPLNLTSVTRASYVGGSQSLGDDWGYAVAVDPNPAIPAGTTEIVVTGYTNCLDFPAIGTGMNLSLDGVFDAFATRIKTDSLGTRTVVWTTYLGGIGDENAYGVTIDRLGYPYIVGNTTSTDFPIYYFPPAAFDATIVGTEGFLACLNPDGTIYYTTFLGGSSSDYPRAVAVDTNFNVHVTGYTYSTNFPVLSPFDGTASVGPDAFVTRLDVSGHGVWSSYLGGNSTDQGQGIAVNNAGTRVVVTGYTYSTDLVPGGTGPDPSFNGVVDAFAAGITGTGTLTWSRYLGGTYYDFGQAVAMDPAGISAVVTGYTYSTDFPTLNALDTTLSGGLDAFVTRLDPNTGNTLWSTYLGGNSSENGNAVALDAAANVYLTGYTISSDFPTKGAVDPTINGGTDVYVTKIYADGAAIAWSTFLGGSANDFGYGIAVDAAGAVYVTGETLSTNFPFTLGLDNTLGGQRDAFVARLDNANPDAPNLGALGAGQFKQNGTTALGVGAWSRETGMIVKAVVGDSDDETVRLEMEIKPVGTPFSNTATVTSGSFPSGTLIPLSVDFPGAAPQSYHWQARSRDVNNRVSAWVSFGGNSETILPGARDVGRDTVDPTVTISSPTPLATYYTRSDSVALGGGTGDDASTVSSVSWFNAGNGSSGGAVGSVPWTTWNILSIPLVVGTNTISVSATDFAGNTGSKVITIYRDLTPPTVSITTPAADPFVTGATSVAMSGAASDLVSLASVTWSNDRTGSGVATFGSGTWSATVTGLFPGLNVITVTATDSAGNTATAQRTINTDSSPPTISITSHASGFVTLSSSVTLTGPSGDNVGVASISWQNFTGVTSGGGSVGNPWSANVPLVGGANSIQVTATDGVGLSASSSITIYRDMTVPTVAISLPTPNPTTTTGSATISLGGSSTDDIGVQSIAWTRQAPPGTPVGGGTGSLDNPLMTSSPWSITGIPLLGNADNQITVTITDRVGRTATDVITVFCDSAAPSILVTAPGTNPFVTGAASVVVSGTANDNTGVIALRVRNTTTATNFTPTLTPALPTTAVGWSATVALVTGTNVISIEADDNASTTSVSITVIYDQTNPTVKIMGPTTADDYYTGLATLALAGTASDNQNVTSVTWSTTGAVAPASGPAGGTPASWTIPLINLALGSQVITITAFDAAGNSATDTLTVVRDPTQPDINITAPSVSATFVTNTSPITLGATASDNSIVSTVTWSNAATGLGGPATAGLPGAWTVANVALLPGSNVITMVATDKAGNLRTDTLTVLYDTSGPSVVINSPSSNPTHVTNAATTALAGTAADDIAVASVEWVNAANGATGIATGTNAWTETAVSLNAGNNVITVTVTDAVGGQSTDVITVHYDPSAPSVAITSPTAQPAYSTTATPIDLAGTASDLTGSLALVDVAQVTWKNLTTGGAGAGLLSPGAWSAAVPLTSGLNSIVVTATDAAGNTASDTLAVTYDPAAPLVTITTPTTDLSYTTGSTPVVLAGTASDDVGVVSVSWSTTGAVVPASGATTGTTAWNASIPLAAGSNLITITATDGVGRAGTSRITIIYDPTPPSIAITTPTADAVFITTISTVTIGGAATDNIDIQNISWINAATGDNGIAQGTGAWSVGNVALVEGPNVITVTAYDGVGNTGQAVVTVIYDGSPPTVAIATPTNTPTFGTSTRPIDIGGTVGDNLQIAGVTWTNDRGGGGTADLTGSATAATWTGSVYLFPGDNVITVTASDAHGYTATDVLTVTFTPETGAPGIAINLPSATGAATSSTQMVTVAGTADDLVGVIGVTWRNLSTGVRGTAVLSGPPTLVGWTADVPLTNGANVIVATAVDDAGNTANATIVVDFASGADGVPPTVSVTGPTLADVYDATVSPVLITISATDDVGVASVRWTNSGTGGDGTAVPDVGSAWTTSVGLAFGANVITITARDPAGNTAVDTLIVNFVPAPGDAAAPLVIIVTPPTGATVNANGVTLDMAGTASDNVDLATVVWSNPATGETGSAEGLDNWTLTLNLAPGINIITVRAYDTSGNTDTDVITVLYTPPPPPPEVVPAGSCGLLGLDAWLLLVGLAAWRRRRPATSRAR